MKSKSIIVAGGIFAFLAVALGAFAAHGLKLDEYNSHVFETAARYQFYHALALILIGVIKLQKPNWIDFMLPIFFIFGIIVFSGSLYALVLTGQKLFGAVTPIGGLSFLVGWIWFVVRICRQSENI